MAYIGNNPKQNTSTLTPQSADPTNPSEGMIFRSDGTSRAEGIWEYKNSNWVQVGSLSNPSLFGLVTGDNTAIADFDTSGLTNCTLATETSNNLNGVTSFKFTNVTSGADEWTATPAVTVPLRSRGKTISISGQFTYDGDDSDISVSLYDNTAAAELSSVSLTASTVSKSFNIVGYLPSTSSSVELRITCDVVNNGKILVFDDIQFSDDPFVYKNLLATEYCRFDTHAGYGSTATYIPYFTYERVNTTGVLVTVTNDSTDGFKIVANKECIVSGHFVSDANVVSALDLGWTVNDDPTTTFGTDGSKVASKERERAVSNATSWAHCSVSVKLSPGDILRPHTQAHTLIAASSEQIAFTVTAESESVVHHNSGTENVFSARITSADVITSQSSPNAPAIASVSSTSTGLYEITYTTDFFGVIPAVTANAETNGLNCHITAEATTGCTVNIESPDGTLTDSDFAIMIQNQGADYKNPNAYAITTNAVAAKFTTDAAQALANGTYDIVDFEDEVYDTHSAVTVGATWKFTAPLAGYYHVTAYLSLANEPGFISGDYVRLQLYKNGSEDVRMDHAVIFDTSQTYVIPNGSADIYLDVGDYIDVRCLQNNDGGGNTALTANGKTNWIAVHKIA